MADEDDRDAAALREAEQRGGDLLDLRHGAGGGFHVLAVHRLDGVHDDEVRRHLLRLSDDVVHQGLAVNQAVGGVAAQAVRPHLHLLDAFLARDVEDFQGRAAEGNLEGKGGLADAGLAAHQHQGALHDAAAEEAVHLGAAEAGNGHRERPLPRHHFLLHHRIPLPAGGTLAHPLGVFVAAVRAEPHGLRFRRSFHSHDPSSFVPLRYKKKILFHLGTISHRNDCGTSLTRRRPGWRRQRRSRRRRRRWCRQPRRLP